MQRRTKWFFLSVFLPLCFVSSGFHQPSAGTPRSSGLCEQLKPCQLLTQADAEKILGQAARLTQDASEMKGEVRQCRCRYTAVALDQASGEAINLYFSFEQSERHPSAQQAHEVMASTKSANIHDTSIIDLSGIGDEAYQLGDGPNVHFIMARKSARVIRLQIKQATAKTSLAELKTLAREIAKRL
ncbi:MAG: hypothetical protein HY231_12070 [Acidobacteria bacterium]|nr:hypothetical protein [Acidobacteriota bacterium]